MAETRPRVAEGPSGSGILVPAEPVMRLEALVAAVQSGQDLIQRLMVQHGRQGDHSAATSVGYDAASRAPGHEEWSLGDFIRPVPGRAVRHGGPGPRTEKLCVTFEGPPAFQVPPGTHLPAPLVFQAGPWFAVDRGAYWEQVEITFRPQVPLPLPQPDDPRFPLAVGHTVRFGSEDWWDWRYQVDGVGHVVTPPKVAPAEGSVFLNLVAPDIVGSPTVSINDDHVRMEVFMMGVRFVREHRCGVVDRSALTLLFTHPQYFAGFLSLWPRGSWVELSRLGRQKVSPYQVAFEVDLCSHPGVMTSQMTHAGRRAFTEILSQRRATSGGR
eukprot:jgi/Mesvir1/14145/Mv25981-RA.1